MPRDLDFDPARELALVRGVISRDEAAIEEFAEKLEKIQRNLASLNARFGRPLNADDRADLEQDTVIVVLKKLSTYEGRAPIDGWVYRICRFEFMNRMRAKGRQPRELPEDAEPASTDGVMQEDANSDRVRRALARVGGVEAEIISLRHYGNLKFPEISKHLEIPLGTVKTRYYRGLQRLKVALESEASDDA